MPTAPKAKSTPKSGPKSGSATADKSAEKAVKPARAKKPGQVKSAVEVQPDSVAEVLAGAPAAGRDGAANAAQGLKMKGLIDEIAARTGAKKTEVKPVAEAVLALLGETLARGEGFTLPGLGKAKVAKSKPMGGGEVLTLKLKRGAEKNANTPLAEADD